MLGCPSNPFGFGRRVDQRFVQIEDEQFVEPSHDAAKLDTNAPASTCRVVVRMGMRTVHGDLLDQDVDVIVNAWNRNIIPWWLLIPQGVSGAIKKRGGYRPFIELGYSPLPLGHARHTSAGRLPHKGIIHVAAINMLWRASVQSIEDCTRAALTMAKEHQYESIAFPVLGSGSGGFDEAKAASLVSAILEQESEIETTLVYFSPS